MKERGPIIILTILLYLFSLTANSQDNRQVDLSKYTQKHGLSSYQITKIIKDTYGFMWIGTQEGLNLYDGTHFEVYSQESPLPHKLGGSFVIDMVEDIKRGLLWVLTAYGDVCAIDLTNHAITRRITHNPKGKLLGDHWLRCIQVVGDQLFIGGHNAFMMFNIDTNQYQGLDLKHKINIGTGECNITKIFPDPYGRIWVCSEGNGIIVLDKTLTRLGVFQRELDNGENPRRKLLLIEMLIRENTLYVATSWGLRTFTLDKDSFTYHLEKHHTILDNSEIQSMAFGPGNQLLFSTPGHFYSFDITSRKICTYEDGSGENTGLSSTFQIYYDSTSRDVWVGMQDGLASFSSRPAPFTAFTKSGTIPDALSHLYAIVPVSPTEAYGGGENCIFHINTKTKSISVIDTASSNYLLFKDADGNLFVSNKNGFHVIVDKKVKPAHTVFPILKDLERDHLCCAVQYNDSLILFASVIQKGLWVWNKRSNELKTYHQDSARHRIDGLSIVNFLYKTHTRHILIVTEKSIIVFNPLTETYSNKEIDDGTGNSIRNLMDVCEYDHGYWIATYGNGLIQTDKNFKVKRIVKTDSGLSNNCVYRVFNYKDRWIIATTNKGLSVLDVANNKIKKYFEEDGLHGNSFEQVCGYDNGATLYCGGVNGFTIVEPDNFYTNPTPPALFLQRIKIEALSGTKDTSNLALTAIDIPSDAYQTTIHFTGLNYSSPSRVSYAYKVAGLSEEWIELGNQNFVNLIGLQPGTYTLQVKAANEDGVESVTPLTIHLTYLPRWFQTMWFKLALVIVVVIGVYSVYHSRMINILRQQQIRREIANDLHDDIGSTLNTLKLFTHLAKKEADNRTHLNQIEESITHATHGLRDMIWVLDDSQDTIFELMERIRKFGLPACAANNITLSGTIRAENSSPIGKTEKRNLLLIAKEVINNSIKYSQCQNITVLVTQQAKITELCIEDDGIGFDLSRVTLGRGILSMQYRAKQINYGIEITSTNTGTRIQLRKSGKPTLPALHTLRAGMLLRAQALRARVLQRTQADLPG